MTLSWVPRLTNTAIVAVTPTISSSPAYTSGDQLGGIQTVAINSSLLRMDSNSNVQTGGRVSMGTATLTEVTILDQALQSAAMDIWFFAASPTVTSVDNGAFALTDANLIAATNGLPITLGYVSVGAAYSAAAASSISTTCNLNFTVGSTTASPIYAIAVVRGTPTYASTTDLVFEYKFIID